MVEETGPIDTDKACSLAGGSRTLAQELFSLLSEELSKARQSLSAGLAARDTDALRTLAHKLRGSARYCAAARLEQAAETAEHAVLHRHPSDSIDDCRARLLVAITEILESQNPYTPG